MTAAKLADAIANARAKVAAGNADYLDEVVVHLADKNAKLVALLEAAIAWSAEHVEDDGPRTTPAEAALIKAVLAAKDDPESRALLAEIKAGA